MAFDLDLDLEHILDAGRAGDHRVQWRSSHLSGRRSDLRKMFTDGQTDGRTDGQTDRRTTDAARLHSWPSWAPTRGAYAGPIYL